MASIRTCAPSRGKPPPESTLTEGRGSFLSHQAVHHNPWNAPDIPAARNESADMNNTGSAAIFHDVAREASRVCRAAGLARKVEKRSTSRVESPITQQAVFGEDKRSVAPSVLLLFLLRGRENIGG